MRPQSRKLFVVWVVFALLAASCVAPAPPTPAPTPGPLDRVKAFQDTYNQRDTDGFLALLADDVGWNLGLVASGVKTVRNIAEYQFEINTRMELSDCTAENGVVACQVAVTDECMPPDLKAYLYNVRFVFKESRISVVWAEEIDSGQLAAFGEYDDARWDWASENMPEVVSVLSYTGGEWDKFHDAERAGKLSAVEFGQVSHQYCTGYTEAGY